MTDHCVLHLAMYDTRYNPHKAKCDETFFSTYLAKKKQKFHLTVCQCIPFKMITVVVVLNSKPNAELILICF